MVERVERVVLIGFSGSGKSTVAAILADRLGWTLVDTDSVVEAKFGTSIAEIFRHHGETIFRAAEREALGAALSRRRTVIAGGGGVVVDPAVWADDRFGRPGTLVIALDAQPETSLRRLVAQHEALGGVAERPLLVAADPLARIAELKAERLGAYDAAHLTLIVDNVSAEEVAAEIAELVGNKPQDEPDLRLQAPSSTSAIYVGANVSERLGELSRARWSLAGRAWVVSDDGVAPAHAPAARASLTAGGFVVAVRTVPRGEGSKSLEVASQLYDWLLDGGIERGDVVVALGGGMVGDLAGFVAATCLRGVGLVQVPTSLLAMVDSSVGGKTGINHRAGKNLIGAFYQPPLVVVDPTHLQTLPARELRSGWAEVVKHAIIQAATPGGRRADLARFLERNAARLLALDEPSTSYLIRRNVRLKAAVVEADEREAGVRALLNFGHTLGHAIEAAGYRLLHGEAIAVGMRAAARIGAAMSACNDDDVALIDGLLDRFGLPARAAVDDERVMALLSSDKKRGAGQQRWVLPVQGGGVCVRDDVPATVVREALAVVTEPGVVV